MKKSFFCGLLTGFLAGYLINEYRAEIDEVIHETGEKIHALKENYSTECPCTKMNDVFNELKIVLKGDQAPAKAIRNNKNDQENHVAGAFDDCDVASCCEQSETGSDENEKTDGEEEEDSDEDEPSSINTPITGNINTSVYHLLTCRYAPKKKENTVIFDQVEAAVKAGFKPCSRCIDH